MLPRSGAWKPASRRSSVVLPLPEGPRIAVNEPAENLEVQAGEDGVGAEALVQIADPQAAGLLEATGVATARVEIAGLGAAHAALALRDGSRSKKRPST